MRITTVMRSRTGRNSNLSPSKSRSRQQNEVIQAWNTNGEQAVVIQVWNTDGEQAVVIQVWNNPCHTNTHFIYEDISPAACLKFGGRLIWGQCTLELIFKANFGGRLICEIALYASIYTVASPYASEEAYTFWGHDLDFQGHRGHKGQIQFPEHNSISIRAINFKLGTDTCLEQDNMSRCILGSLGWIFGVTRA